MSLLPFASPPGSSGGGGSLPSQSGNAGKFLETNGSTPSWQWTAIEGGTTDPVSAQTYQLFYNTTQQSLKIWSGSLWTTLATVSFDSLWDSVTDPWDSTSMDWDSPL